MLHYANLSLILYSILKLLTYHTSFYTNHRLVINAQNRSGFFGPLCSILPQYDKTKLFWIFCLLCHQKKIKTIS